VSVAMGLVCLRMGKTWLCTGLYGINQSISATSAMPAVQSKIYNSETISRISLGEEPGDSRSRLTTRSQPDFSSR
jgi:hypothetical protein